MRIWFWFLLLEAKENRGLVSRDHIFRLFIFDFVGSPFCAQATWSLCISEPLICFFAEIYVSVVGWLMLSSRGHELPAA